MVVYSLLRFEHLLRLRPHCTCDGFSCRSCLFIWTKEKHTYFLIDIFLRVLGEYFCFTSRGTTSVVEKGTLVYSG